MIFDWKVKCGFCVEFLLLANESLPGRNLGLIVDGQYVAASWYRPRVDQKIR